MKKFKKIIAVALSLALLVGVTTSALAGTDNSLLYKLLNSGTGTTYYVDSEAGDDTNPGTSKLLAWKTLDKVNSMEFSAGDSILFKSGCTFIGQLMFKGSGNAENGAIVIDKYGDSDALPIINANGATENDGAVIRLYNQEYIEISNLELTNNSYTTQGIRSGVYVIAEDFGVVDHVYIRNCNIHDVVTNATKKVVEDSQNNGGEGDFLSDTGSTSGAIAYVALRGGAMVPSAFNDIFVDGNTIARTGRGGSGVAITNEWLAFVDDDENAPKIQEGYHNEAPFYGSTNILISNNNFANTSAAIRFQGVDGRVGNGVIAEYNVSYKADNSDSNGAMWANNSYNVVWQHNEVYGLDNGGINDCCAFDADGYSQDTIFQYNYTHDNRGESVMFCNVGWVDYYDKTNTIGSVYRYNISQNDMWGANESHGRLWVQEGAAYSWFYNNVIYVGAGLKGSNITIAKSYRNYIYNNVFINLSEETTYEINQNSYTDVDNNCFYGYHPSSEPTGDNNIKLDTTKAMPLVDPGKGGVGINTLQGYMLTEDSVLKGAGKVVANNGGKDFFGNTVSSTAAPDIGVHQSGSSEDTSAPTAASNVNATVQGYSSIKLTWSAGTDDVGIDHYVIYVNDNPVGRVNGTTTQWVATDLLSNTEYSFFVRAFDANGNYEDSDETTATTNSATAEELQLKITNAAVYNEAGAVTTTFGAEQLVAPRFTVVDGNNNPVKNALVTVLVSAETQSDYETVTDMTDENGIAQTGFYTNIYRGNSTAVTVEVKNIAKAGHTYNGSENDTVSFNVTGISDEASANIAQNPGFENGTTNWTITNGKITSEDVNGGTAALKFSSNQIFTGTATQSYTSIPNGVYTLTYYVKNVGASVIVNLSGYGSNTSETIPVSEEWQQVSFPDIKVTTGVLYLEFKVHGDDTSTTYFDDVELTRNLLTNTYYTNTHANSKLPADFYYTTENGTISDSGDNIELASQDQSIKAVSIVNRFNANKDNALKVSSGEEFNVTMGQNVKNIPNGSYTLKVSTINQSSMDAYLVVKDYGGTEIKTKIPISISFKVTKINNIPITTGSAVVELHFESNGNANEYIYVSSFALTAQTDYPDTIPVTPVDYNILSTANNSFENDGCVTTTVPRNWKNNWSNGTVECIATDEYANTGTYSAKVTLHHEDQREAAGAKLTEISLTPEIKVYNNLTTGLYNVSFWAKGDYKVKLNVTANGADVYEAFSEVNDEWHQVKINKVPVTNGQLSISFYCAKSETDEFKTYTAYIDDVSFQRVESSYEAATQIPGVSDIENGQSSVELPVVDGYIVGVVDSSNKDVISADGKVITPLNGQTVTITLSVQNASSPKDITYIKVNVNVLGMIDEFGNLNFILGDANNDASFNVGDIVRFKKYIADSKNNLNTTAVDDDENGELSDEDLATLRDYLISEDGYGAYTQGEANWNNEWD